MMDMHDQLVADMERRRANPEVFSFVALKQDEAVARSLGHTLVQRAHPDRRVGDVLQVIDNGDGTIEVLVQDHGPKYLTTQGPSPEGRIR